MQEIRLNLIQNPGSIDPSFLHLSMVTDTDLMQAAAYRHFNVGTDGLAEIVMQFDCIRLYVDIGQYGIDVATWQDELYEFTYEWFNKHHPDCSVFHQEPAEAPPTLAQLHEAPGKPDMDGLAEGARWAVNGLAYGHHQMRFAFGTTYQCTHDSQFYAAIAGMATELIQHIAVTENLETTLPEQAASGQDTRRDALTKQRDHWQGLLDGLDEMAPALHDADQQRLVIQAHLDTTNQQLALLPEPQQEMATA